MLCIGIYISDVADSAYLVTQPVHLDNAIEMVGKFVWINNVLLLVGTY